MTKPRAQLPARRLRTIEHQLPLSGPAVNIAMVQLEGPRPRGKHRSVVVGRDTFAWQSLEEIRAREQKALSILRALAGLTEKPDLIVFPEYSLPVLESLESLQREANEQGFIIVPGADNMQRVSNGPILTEAVVIVPNREPVWIAKREPSQWEYGFVDQPPRPAIHTFSWRTTIGECWLVVYPCLDLLHALRDPIYDRAGPGLFIVPMCSPDITTFWTYADALLRRDSGSACVLCNCVGEGAAGQSSVVAITPSSSATHPAVVLSESTESAAIISIHCDRLAPPRKAPLDPVVAVGKRRIYTIYSALGGVTLAPVAEQGLEAVTRGVLNPALFAYLGKKMRVAFVRMERFGEAQERVRTASFEVLAILGHHDLMVTHVRADAHDLFYEVLQRIPVRLGFNSRAEPGHDPDPQTIESFPFFEVEVFHKVLGVPVDEAARQTFTDPGKPLPTPDDIEALVSLATDWNDVNVGAETQRTFVERQWILATTQRQPGHIGAIIAIYLFPASGDVAEQLATFSTHVLPALVRNQAVTSIYEGVGHRLPMHYLLRVTATPGELFGLIDAIHSACMNARLLITTSTSVVIRRLADLVLDRAFLDPVLSPEDHQYSSHRYAPNLGPSDRMRFIKLDRGRQEAILLFHREVNGAITSLRDAPWLNSQMRSIQERLALGLLNGDIGALREIHDVLQRHVEALLVGLISDLANKRAPLDDWLRTLGIPGTKPIDRFTYGERIKIVAHAARLGLVNAEIAADGSLLTETVAIRNAYAHDRFEDVSIADVVHAVKAYCRFWNRWGFGQ